MLALALAVAAVARRRVLIAGVAGWSSNHSATEVHAAPEGHKPGPQLPSAVTCGVAPRSRLAGASHEGRHIEAGDDELGGTQRAVAPIHATDGANPSANIQRVWVSSAWPDGEKARRGSQASPAPRPLCGSPFRGWRDGGGRGRTPQSARHGARPRRGATSDRTRSVQCDNERCCCCFYPSSHPPLYQLDRLFQSCCQRLMSENDCHRRSSNLSISSKHPLLTVIGSCSWWTMAATTAPPIGRRRSVLTMHDCG